MDCSASVGNDMRGAVGAQISLAEGVETPEMITFDSTTELVDRLDQLSTVLASTQDMTIYHGFIGGERPPYEAAIAQLESIEKDGSAIRDELLQFQDQKDGSSLITLCITYANRLLANAELLRTITRKLKQSADGGSKYGFWKFWKDSKEWKLSTKKLLNVRSNVEIFLRNSDSW